MNAFKNVLTLAFGRRILNLNAFKIDMLSRAFVALLLVISLAACGVALLQAGIYGWTLFALLPSILGAVAS